MSYDDDKIYLRNIQFDIKFNFFLNFLCYDFDQNTFEKKNVIKKLHQNEL